MMDLGQWKRALQIQIGGLELMLKNISGQPYSLEIKNAGSLSTEDAEQQMQQAEIMARFAEKNFQSEISLGFSNSWINLLAKEAEEEQAQEEIETALIGEFSANIMDILTSVLAETGVEVDIAQIDITRDKRKLAPSDHKKYFLACLEAISDPESDDEQTATPSLKFWIALSHPDEEQFTAYEKKFEPNNPFMDDRYSEMMVRYVRHSSDKADYKGSVSRNGREVEFEDFSESKTIKKDREVRNIDILKNVEMHVSVELGRRKMPLGNILKLVKGSVIELEKLAGEPVEILVNGHKIAQGDVVVIDEYFGVRVSNLLASQEHIKELQ